MENGFNISNETRIRIRLRLKFLRNDEAKIIKNTKNPVTLKILEEEFDDLEELIKALN